MAKVLSLLRGEISGKIGDKVYYQLNGRTVVRNMPAKTKWTPTAKQAKAQQRFKSIIHYCRKFKNSVIPLVWDKLPDSWSGWSLFLKTNAPAFDPDGVPGDVCLLQLSMGKLTLPLEFTAHRKAGDPSVIEVSWKKNLSLGGVLLWDELMAVSAANDEYSSIISTGIKRGDLGGSFLLPALKAPATHLFLFFASNDRNNFSNSVCFEI
ncbi:MAG TPA: hypothetical protein VFG54_06935 [Prolixibacteraceae bacterium]|nr:hypothetical protein [Prolixibacteraceae bacterium]